VTAVVVSVGARTPIGLGAVDTGFLYRASAVAMREAALLDPDEQPVTMCLLPTLPPLLVGHQRALRLAQPALEEAIGALGPALGGLRTRFAICLDEPIAGERPDPSDAATLVATLERRLAELGVRATSSVHARGPASLGHALPELIDALARGTIDAAVVGGMHTDYTPARIAALAAAGRLFTPDNLDAIIPGECAAFVVLARPDVARRLQQPTRVELLAVATGFEKARPDNDESAFEAIGLTAAVRTAAAPIAGNGRRIGWILTDLSFESQRLFELTSVMTRLQPLFCEPQYCDSPAHRLGHMGAAAMPLHLVLAAEAWRRGWAPHTTALSIAGTDTGERAAMLLAAPVG
jgi:3-oxoacyl-[acyl-carrier-protein] synthase-1